MKNVKSLCLALMFVLSVCFSFNTAFALTRGFQAISLTPATDGGPYIGIWGSRNLDRWKWELGTLGVYAYRPLQLTQNGNRARGILDHTIVQHFYGHVGLIDRWLSIGFDLPMGWWADFTDPNVATATNQKKVVVSDININLKSELLRTDHFGIALLPFLTVPTGYGREFFGNGNVTGGGSVIAEVKPVDRWSVALNAGIQGRQTFIFRDIDKSDQLLLGLGTAVQITKPVSIVAEIATSTRVSGPFSEKVETPTEARGAIKWSIDKTGLLASAGGTAGILRGSGAPTYSIFAGLGFSPTRREHKPSPVLEELNFKNYTVYFSTDSYSVTESKEAKKLYDLSDKIRDKKINIKVEGHADSTGPEKYNEKLSQERADKIGWFLKLLGIDPSRVTFIGKGSSEPAGDNATPDGRAENRRVEFGTVK